MAGSIKWIFVALITSCFVPFNQAEVGEMWRHFKMHEDESPTLVSDFVPASYRYKRDITEKRVTSVHPPYGGMNGATRLTIKGKGFASSMFNLFNEDLGNFVFLVSSTLSFVCDMHKDGCTKTQLECYTRPMPVGTYKIKVYVDGEKFSEDAYCTNKNLGTCTFQPSKDYTPTIDKIKPRSGSTNDFIVITEGLIFTDKYSSTQETSTNGNLYQLLKAWAYGQKCNLMTDEPDVLYGLALISDDSNYGEISCKIEGAYVGVMNITYIFEAPYGRSLPNPTSMHLWCNQKLGMVQSYLVILALSPPSGSIAGGTDVAISSSSFANPFVEWKCWVGDQPCEKTVFDVDNRMLICRTAARSLPVTHFQGGRGMKADFWDDYKSFEDLLQMDNFNLETSSGSLEVDESFIEFDNAVARQSIKIRTFFVPALNGMYKFYVRSTHDVILFFSAAGPAENKIQIASCQQPATTFWENDGQGSMAFYLESGNAYYMELLHSKVDRKSSVEFAAQLFNSSFTASQTGDAINEKQMLEFTSQSFPEIWEIRSVDDPPEDGINYWMILVEILNGKGANSEARFRLGLNDVYTKQLLPVASWSDMEEALNELSTLTGKILNTKDEEEIKNGMRFKFAIPPSLFHMSDFDVKYEDIDPSTTNNFHVSVTKVSKQDQKYVESLKQTVEFDFEKIKALLGMYFSSEAPTDVRKMMKMMDDDDDDSIYKMDFEDSGTTEAGAFTGRKASKNPQHIYNTKSPSINLKIYQTLCFGLIGRLKDDVEVKFQYIPNDIKLGKRNKTITVSLDEAYYSQIDNDWKFAVINLMNTVDISKMFLVQLLSIKIEREDDTENIWIDTVSIVDKNELPKDLKGVLTKRRPAWTFGGAAVKAFTVDDLCGDRCVSITIEPHYCGKVTLPTISNEMKPYFSLKQIQKASTPVGGTFTMTLGAVSLENIPVIDPTVTTNIIHELKWFQDVASAMKANIEAKMADNTQIDVSLTGECHRLVFVIEWTNKGGDIEEILLNTKNLSGDSVTASVKTMTDGYLLFAPIPGDMLRTVHNSPQIRCTSDDIPTKCKDSDACSFTYSQDLTPSITRVTPDTASYLREIEITGNGFSGLSDDYTVSIGGVDCSIVSVLFTSIRCSLGNGPMGEQLVEVWSSIMGKASGSVTFTYIAIISEIEPDSGSRAGGTHIMLFGLGFSSLTTVTIGEGVCMVQSVDAHELVCITPRTSENGDTVTAEVKVTTGNFVVTTQFTYKELSTPHMTDVSKRTSSVDGGEKIEISGAGFGSYSTALNAVKIGDATAKIVTWSDELISVLLPSNPQGKHQVKVSVGILGYASSDPIEMISYELTVSSITPLRGSLHGGTVLHISGNGFGTNREHLKVMVGKHTCDIEDKVTDDEFYCTISRSGQIITVTNEGEDFHFGHGYAWMPNFVDIETGSCVIWQWNAPDLTADVFLTVQEVGSAAESTPLLYGISAGKKVKTGRFIHCFEKPGTYFFSSGVVLEELRHELRCTVNVHSREASTEEIYITAFNEEANYNLPNVPVAETNTESSCKDALNPINECTPASTSFPSGYRPSFQFHKCFSGTIYSFCEANSDDVPDCISGSDHEIRGTAKSKFLLTGFGLGTENCQNTVMIGNAQCDVTFSSSDKILCQLNNSAGMKSGIKNRISVSVSVKNRGHCSNQIGDGTFLLLPSVNSIAPTSISTEGGATLDINGDGFSGIHVIVMVDDSQCMDIKVQSSSWITCVAPKHTKGKVVVKIYWSVDGLSTMEVHCTDQCAIEYSRTVTPIITSITEHIISFDAAIEIGGTNFGPEASDISVSIGEHVCVVNTISNTKIVCNQHYLPVGIYSVTVNRKGVGNAVSTDISVESRAYIKYRSLSTVSSYGGAILKFTANGLVPDHTAVTVNGLNCHLLSVTFGEVEVVVPAFDPFQSGEHPVDVVLTSDDNEYIYEPPETNFFSITYSSSIGPQIDSIELIPVTSDDFKSFSLKIHGSLLKDSKVRVGEAECTVDLTSDILVECTLGYYAAGNWNVVLTNEFGDSAPKSINLPLELMDVSPVVGSILGKQLLTIRGSGLSQLEGDISVKICDELCELYDDWTITPNKIMCSTPAQPSTHNADPQECDVTVTVNGIEETISSSYSFATGSTPNVVSISPDFGPTLGGNVISIAGTGLSTIASVRINKVVCELVEGGTNEHIDCILDASVGADPSLEVLTGLGKAIIMDTIQDYNFLDVWSAASSWLTGLPEEGDFVVVPIGQVLYFDEDASPSPILKLVLIQGGALIFKDEDVEFNAENILIVAGGRFQVGTAEHPFQHKAIITMHGFLRSPELPIYGAKCLAVREGILDMHGKHHDVTWTGLAVTAKANQNEMEIVDDVNWKIGDELIVATTGHRHSQKESEHVKIDSISGKVIKLVENLQYDHVVVHVDDPEITLRAEVGLLTHSIVFKGNVNVQFNREQFKENSCPEGFDTGEFETQTCFQGRFGEVNGRDNFGATIMIHSEFPDENKAVARLENLEVTNAGQSFRLGRYPIHFHLNGYMNESYVKRCSVHRSSNRAVNIHNTHNVTVSHNVIFDIMGGAFFLEDGIEQFNILDYNLGVFVHPSSSLLNDDIAPAAFWITNPQNTVKNNVAAGGTNFGFWYRMNDHSTGPSSSLFVCPPNYPLGEFTNNSGHSLGWFGLWIFPLYVPKVGAACDINAQDVTAVFRGLISWNCEKGAEALSIGNVQFKDFILVNNEKSGIDIKLLVLSQSYSEDGPMFSNSTIIGCLSELASQPGWAADGTGCTAGGIVMPFGNSLLLNNVTFRFFEGNCHALKFTFINGRCPHDCGGFTVFATGLVFTNVGHRMLFTHEHEGVFISLDGSFFEDPDGHENWSTTVGTPATPDDCEDLPSEIYEVTDGMAKRCPQQHQFVRFAMNNIKPGYLIGEDLKLSNQYGSMIVHFNDKQITHSKGWHMIVLAKKDYTIEFPNAKHFTNTSMDSAFFGFSDPTFCMVITSYCKEKPDLLAARGSLSAPQKYPVSCITSPDSAWYYNEVNHTCAFVLSNHPNTDERKKRAPEIRNAYHHDAVFNLEIVDCFFPDCKQPPDRNTVPPLTSRPNPWYSWCDASIWPNNVLPQDGDDIVIESGLWIVVLKDCHLPKINKLTINGGLEFDNEKLNKYPHMYSIEATYILVYGYLVAGWNETDVFEAELKINLLGSRDTVQIATEDGRVIGSKVIANFGVIFFFGNPPLETWTRITHTIVAGSIVVKTKGNISDWKVGWEILVTSTEYDMEDEIRFIAAVNGENEFEVTEPFDYTHTFYEETLPTGKYYSTSAEVGTFTRNIQIVGAEYADQEDELYGARVLNSFSMVNNQLYIGCGCYYGVEWVRAGQQGYTSNHDARFSLTFYNTDYVTDIKPSQITKCSFHHNYATAIGLFGAHNVPVIFNVVWRTDGPGIKVISILVWILHNLFVRMVNLGYQNDKRETFNIACDGIIEAWQATELVLRNNVVSGSNCAGYHVCPLVLGDTTTPEWYGNEAHSNFIGFGLYALDEVDASSDKTWWLTSFMSWYNYGFGTYYANGRSFFLEDFKSIGDATGVFLFVIGPSSTLHIIERKSCTMASGLVVGTLPGSRCTTDVMNYDDIKLRNKGPNTVPGAHSGLYICTFSSGSNKSPEKSYMGTMSYQSIHGKTFIDNITFAHFNEECGYKDLALSVNRDSDDGIHPAYLSNLTLHDVPENNKINIPVPNLSKINSADCVDMDCDGLKKCIIENDDGTFFESLLPGTIIPMSEYEWDGNRSRGLGNYRIPRAMLIDTNGNVMQYEKLAKNHGIIRKNCTFHDEWHAYECHGYDYGWLHMESMDVDTESRRLSPIAVLGYTLDSDGNEIELPENGYVDLINGPQDHGWCSGYTCRKRLSTFMAIVATGIRYRVYLSSTQPRVMRYFLLNSNDKQAVELRLYYKLPMSQINVYVDGLYVSPSNALYDNGHLTLTGVHTPLDCSEDGDPAGTNFMNYEWNELHIIARGYKLVLIQVADCIFVGVKTQSITIAEFFGSNIVENLMSFLGLKREQLKVVHVSRAGSRKRRSADDPEFDDFSLAITNVPSETLDETPIDPLNLHSILISLVDEVQTGNISKTLNQTIKNIYISGPVPDPSSKEWKEFTESATGSELVEYRTVDSLVLYTAPVPSGEHISFGVQPKLRAFDSNGIMVVNLGVSSSPWQVYASLRSGSNPRAILGGTVTITFVNGWANFTDLSISHEGSGYIINFDIVVPTTTDLSVASDALTMPLRTLLPYVYSLTTPILKDNVMELVLGMKDFGTDEMIEDVNWNGYAWTVQLSIVDGFGAPADLQLLGTTTHSISAANGKAVMNDLVINKIGLYRIKARYISTPAAYDFAEELNEDFDVRSPEHANFVFDLTNVVKIKFEMDYNTVVGSTPGLFAKHISNQISGLDMFKNIHIIKAEAYEGSIIVELTMEGDTDKLTSAIIDLCDDIKNGTSFVIGGQTYELAPYLTVDGIKYYGVRCGEIEEAEEAGLSTGGIVGIVLGILALLAVIILFIILWKFIIYPKTKTHEVGSQYIGKLNIEDILYRQDTFHSLRERSFLPDNPKPALDTSLFTRSEGDKMLSLHL